MFPCDNVASIKIGGKFFSLKQGAVNIDGLKIELKMENRAENLYSWVVYVENESDERSPIITELYGLDLSLSVEGRATLNTLRGDNGTVYSFFPESFDLKDGESVSRAPTGARSSDTSAFPYFDIVDSQGNGLVCGIGWSGQWKLTAERSGERVRVCAGFQDCHFYLEPHEKVRSIRALVYFGEGGADSLRHDFVRLHRRHYSPIPEANKNAFFPVSMQCFDRYYWGNVPKENETIYFETEHAQLNIIKNALKYKHFNAHWLDACWFDGAFRSGVGNYRYASGFKNTLKPISRLAHKNNMRFILWFEPVRVDEGTDLYEKFKDDPNKIITLEGEKLILANLGDGELWRYQFEHICEIIKQNGVDIYRQDFNIAPYEFLKSRESEDRRGIMQIHFTIGIYKLWDALKERFPNLLIDNCAAGGRMLDVETLSRAIPLWRSDMNCRPSPLASQNHILGLSRYIPYHQGGSYDYTPYFLRSSFTTGVACEFGFLEGIIDPAQEKASLEIVSAEQHLPSRVSDFSRADSAFVEKSLAECLSLREYWSGDFTALTPPSDSREAMVAYSLHLEGEERGVALIFRRESAPDSYTLKLVDLNPEREYELVFSNEQLEQNTVRVLGKALADGLEVSIPTAPASLLIFYKAI